MSNERAQCSKGKLKYFATTNCPGCREISKKLEVYKDTVEKQQNTIIEILAEHKVLLDRLLSQNVAVENIMSIFPINSDEKLKEFDNILATNADPYKRQMQHLIAGNAERNLHQIFGQNIIINYNVDGISGKKRLRDLCNVFSVIIDVISTFSKSSDTTLRAAFQRQKKKFFKQTTRIKTQKNKENRNDEENETEKYEEIELIEEIDET
ncbi:uncharacterized protein LOC118735493 [Rhagoletis pomonella]|uniref:uncharacterized protein LOC118735493 n=1 Tax=Rhagoletis pomonella TaxID=28610 RepID=UPI00178312DE|nr:uncharacterized protein LOC118735493 [Rhagoletis pomonella]